MHADWRAAYQAEAKHMWERERVVTMYRRVATEWEPLDVTGFPASFAHNDHGSR